MEIGTGIAVSGVSFSIAVTVIKIFGKSDKEDRPQCAVHAVVMENLKEAMDEIKDRLGKIEGAIAQCLTGINK